MFTYRRKIINKKQIVKNNFLSGSWIDCENLTELEIEKISARHKINVGVLIDSQDIFESPRVEFENGNMYFFTRFPAPKGTEDLSTLPFLFVANKNFILTSFSLKKTPFFIKTLRENNKKSFSTNNQSDFFIEFFKEINNKFITGLRSIRKEVYQNKTNLGNISDKNIERFVELETIVNDFVATLIPTVKILKKTIDSKIFKTTPYQDGLIEDIFLEQKQLIESGKNILNMIRNIREAYTTITTNKLNKTLKTLTIITLVLTIPTIISSFFGMNTITPFQNSESAFFNIIIISMIISILTILFLKKKKWF